MRHHFTASERVALLTASHLNNLGLAIDVDLQDMESSPIQTSEEKKGERIRRVHRRTMTFSAHPVGPSWPNWVRIIVKGDESQEGFGKTPPRVKWQVTTIILVYNTCEGTKEKELEIPEVGEVYSKIEQAQSTLEHLYALMNLAMTIERGTAIAEHEPELGK